MGPSSVIHKVDFHVATSQCNQNPKTSVVQIDVFLLALPSALNQECPVTFKLMTSYRLVQRARPLTGQLYGQLGAESKG